MRRKPLAISCLGRGCATTCAAVLLITVTMGCDGGTNEAAGWSSRQKNGIPRLRVLCTTTIITDLARNIVHDLAEVNGIMKEGEDPHIYDVRPRDVQLINSADLVLMNGLHLEATLTNVIDLHGPKGAIIRLAEDSRIKTLGSESTKGASDPHCWFNIEYFKVYTENTRDALVHADSDHAEKYRQHAEEYLRQLDELHRWVKQQVLSIPRERRIMITSHDAFQYFGRAYDIEVYAVIGISTDQQPTGRDKLRLQQLVEQRGAKALFIETSVSNALNDMVRQIAKATSSQIGGTLYSDALGPPETPAGTYLGMVQHNVKTVVEALK